MALTRQEINEAKNFPTERIREKAKGIKDTLNAIEASQMERDSRKSGMPDGLAKEVAAKVVGPVASLRKKLKETIEDKKPTDDIRANLASKRALEQMEKEAAKLKQTAVTLNRKVAAELSKLEPKALKVAAAQRKAKDKYESGKKKAEQERKFMSGKYAAESVNFKDKVRSYLSLNEMAMKHFGPDAQKKYSKDELKELFNKTAVDSLANTYVKNAREEGMDDTKIAQGLGATLRGMEDKDKVAKVKEAVKAKLELKPRKKAEKKETKEEKKEEKKSTKPGFLGK